MSPESTLNSTRSSAPNYQGSERHDLRDIFVGRQPIYNRQLDVVGYEVLFRNGAVSQADVLDGDHATAQVLLNTFLDIGFDAVVEHKPAFINFTRNLLLQGTVYAFPADLVTVEVLENVVVDADLTDAISRLSAQGYTIALDDFRYCDHLRPLVEVADIVKIDVQALDRPTLEDHLAILREYDVTLLAEKVETPEEFRYYKGLGFEYFQGYFFCRPDLVKGKQTPTNRLLLLQLLAELQNPEIDFHDLDVLVSRDVTLSYKLLRVINSAFYGLPQKVESLPHALLLLGTKVITKWVSLILMASLDDKPRELMTTAMVRARMCERLAEIMRQQSKDSAFLVGLFSVLDALLDRPLTEVLQGLPLRDDISQALLHQEGMLGALLRCVLSYERGAWEEVNQLDVEPEVLVNAYLDALAWARDTANALMRV